MMRFQPFWNTLGVHGKEGFFVVYDIESAGAGYDGAFQPGSSTPLGLAGGTIKEGTLEKSGGTAKTVGNIELSATEAAGLRGQLFNAKFCKVEAENEEEAIKFAGEAYGRKGGSGYAVKSSAGAFKKG